MRLSDYRQYELKEGITRQLTLASLFLALTGCAITGNNNPLTVTAMLQELPEDPEDSRHRSNQDSSTPSPQSSRQSATVK
jgi:hypothetical protein